MAYYNEGKKIPDLQQQNNEKPVNICNILNP